MAKMIETKGLGRKLSELVGSFPTFANDWLRGVGGTGDWYRRPGQRVAGDDLVKGKVPESTPLGYSGTEFYTGFLRNLEYITDLTRRQAILTYDQMARSDAQIHASLEVIKQPIRAATWYIDAMDESNNEIAEGIEKNLMEEMDITWSEFLRQALSAMEFGFSIFEKAWEYDEGGNITLKRLAPRIQRSLWKWKIDSKGDWAGIQQYTQCPDMVWRFIDISSTKLLRFTINQDGQNFEGQSIIRPAYGNWLMKNELYKIDMIGHDRWASGTLDIEAPAEAKPEDINNMKKAAANIYSREQSYLIKPFGWKSSVMEAHTNNSAILESIKHHNEQIAMNVLAQFLTMGSSQHGARALGASFVDLFLMCINSYADYFADTINRGLIKQWCDYNWTLDVYPQLKHEVIRLHPYDLIESINACVLQGTITMGTDVENQIREMLNLPAKADMAVSTVPDPEGTGSAGQEAEAQPQQLNERRKFRRQLTEAETKLADVARIATDLDIGATRYQRQIIKVRKQQARGVADQIGAGKKASEIKVPFIPKLAQNLKTEMLASLDRGGAGFVEDAKRQIKMSKLNVKLADKKPKKTAVQKKADVLKFIDTKAEADATKISNDLMNSAITQLNTLPPGEDIEGVELADYVYGKIVDGGIRAAKTAGESASVMAYQFGRSLEAEDYSDEIEYCVRSTILDDNACETCLPKDGVEFQLGDAEFDTPDMDCVGLAYGHNCRCVTLYKMRDMEGDFVTRTKADYEARKDSWGVGDSLKIYDQGLDD